MLTFYLPMRVVSQTYQFLPPLIYCFLTIVTDLLAMNGQRDIRSNYSQLRKGVHFIKDDSSHFKLGLRRELSSQGFLIEWKEDNEAPSALGGGTGPG